MKCCLGQPQDHGYGRGLDGEGHAIHDTKMALNEAKRKGIVLFRLTVDRAGHDYLKTMCEDIGYEVVADIESPLPPADALPQADGVSRGCDRVRPWWRQADADLRSGCVCLAQWLLYATS
ncbi:MAG: hypothetical protein U0531_15475 [Dehalococcoidia bacterium]